MSTKKREPLLKDLGILGRMAVRDFYEAARAKDAQLIQRFVDHNDKWLGKGCIEADMEWDNIVLDCIKAGYKPSEP
jgi:hypothetical protein